MPAAAASKKRSSSTKAKRVAKVAKKKRDYSRPVFGMLQTKISRRPGPGGNALWTTLIYTQKGNLIAPGLNVATGNTWRADSLFDPDFTGVGGQPVSFDQLAEIYERYVVWKTEYKIVMVNQNNARDLVVGVFISDAPPTLLDEQRMIQNGMCDWTLLERQGGSASRATFTGTIDLPKLHGMTKKAYMDDDVHQALVNDNPSDGAYLTIFTNNLDPGSSLTTEYRYELEMRFHVKFMGSKFTVLS